MGVDLASSMAIGGREVYTINEEGGEISFFLMMKSNCATGHNLYLNKLLNCVLLA